jgi:hypothetical protein
MSEYPQRRYVYVRVFILYHILRMYVFIFYASAQHKIQGLSCDIIRLGVPGHFMGVSCLKTSIP